MSDPHADPLPVSLDVSAVPRQAVGVGRFALDLSRALVERDDVRVTLFTRRNDRARWSEASGLHHPARLVAAAPGPRPLRLAWEQLRLPRLVDAAGVVVHHSPHYTMPERAHVPIVVTIHDLTFFDHPEWHERTKVVFFRRAISVAARRAKALLCDSRHTAERLKALLDPEGSVFVVPLGVDLTRFAPYPEATDTSDTGDVGGEGTFSDLRARDEDSIASLGLRRPYVLFLGTLEPRKAVPELVAAFDILAARERELGLVLAGKPGWGAKEVEGRVAASGHRERIRLTGYVPDEAVPALLRRAAVVAYPAKEEGFGLPALEALACGTPLVTTSGTVMAELAGKAALTVTPGDVDELAQALAIALGGDETGDRRRLGLEVAAAHSWQACAASHVSAYRSAAL